MGARTKLLITGAGGQLGSALQRAAWPDRVDAVALGRDQLDISSAAQVDAAIGAGGYAVVVNAAAYTAVDRAESEADQAFAVNHLGPENVAKACARHGAL